MCGIIGYVGFDDCQQILLKGLKSLEYRGYDSAGIAYHKNDSVKLIKSVGEVNKLINMDFECNSCCGIGHTRWATHGAVNKINCHPHKFENITVVHNGIIENYKQLINEFDLKNRLISQTDSEVIAAVIAHYYIDDPIDAIIKAVQKLKGAYSIEIMLDNIQNTIFAVRNISPLVFTATDTGCYISSDLVALAEYSNIYYTIPENTILRFSKNSYEAFDMDKCAVKLNKQSIDIVNTKINKENYPFYMEKEIFEQSIIVKSILKAKINHNNVFFSNDKIKESIFDDIDRIIITACGTAMHSGLVLKYLVEKYARISCEVVIASEFINSNSVISDRTLVICISQSGETIDTIKAMNLAKSKKAKLLSIINVKGSTMDRECENVIYTNAGAEISVASTKAYTSQVLNCYLIAFNLSNKYNPNFNSNKFLEGLLKIPKCIDEVLEDKTILHRISQKIIHSKNLFMIGRGLDYIAIIEASLKLKEISYIHSEAFAAGELKHGTIALVESNTPVIALSTQVMLYDSMLSNITEVKSRGANVIALSNISERADYILPKIDDDFSLLPSIIALQLIAYYTALDKGIDVDKPRNLAKVVTVE